MLNACWCDKRNLTFKPASLCLLLRIAWDAVMFHACFNLRLMSAVRLAWEAIALHASGCDKHN